MSTNFERGRCPGHSLLPFKRGTPPTTLSCLGSTPPEWPGQGYQSHVPLGDSGLRSGHIGALTGFFMSTTTSIDDLGPSAHQREWYCRYSSHAEAASASNLTSSGYTFRYGKTYRQFGVSTLVKTPWHRPSLCIH